MNQESGKNAQRMTYMIEVAFTIVVTFVIGYVAKNIVEKKLHQQEMIREEAEQFGDYDPKESIGSKKL